MNLLEELEGKGWSIQQALLTTFPFDPQFFSGYVRPRLSKRNCDLPLVLVDANRYERNIASSDWREAPIGTDYLLEPVYSDGVFHPKVNLYASERSVYFTVSSANLGLEEYCKAAQIGYGGGFQRYWLSDNEYDVGEALPLAREIRDFFDELLNVDGYVTGHDARDYIRETATTLDWLDNEDAPQDDDDRTVWFLSNLSEPILEQVVERVGDVETVQMYAPFYGSANVLSQMADRLDAERLEFVVEAESTAMDVAGLPDTIDRDFAVQEMKHSSTRWVHAKYMTLEGDWGTACLYGSPNMTSTALLEPASSGNVEAGILQVFASDQSRPLDGSLFHNASFPFELSDPVADLDSLSLRSQSYEGWEGKLSRDSVGFRLLDAQLTRGDSDKMSELILRLEGISGEHSFLVSTEAGDERRLEASLESDSELSILLNRDEREEWIDAVVTVSIPDKGVQSNVRRVVQESQEYYREYRDITRSAGTQSSTALLRKVLQNPDASAAGVFNIALSELRKMSQQGSAGGGNPTPDGKGAPQFPERSPARLAGASSSAPSLPKLIESHLSYQRERALDVLTADERPTPDSIERVVDHLDTFWETIQLCLVMDCLRELDSTSTDVKKLFEVCYLELSELVNQLPIVVRRLNGIIDRIEQEPNVKKEFLTDEIDTVDKHPLWATVFDSIFLHPSLVLELDYIAGREVTAPRNEFARKIKSSLTLANPAIWQYLFDGSYVVSEANVYRENLQVDYGEEDQEAPVTTAGTQTLLLYILVQQAVSSPGFLDGLRNHPKFSTEGIEALAEFAVQADDDIVKYGLVGRVQWGFTLKQAYTDVRGLL
ncbi:hypothetical protein [Haloferax volcanii]|uniref:hypothetical protein n=1 Tax=Haloferax volcanii TaxID=2246 RepID=UPI0023DA7198|nr:hypothetical protein [Haloferax lucentense]WEL27345.1 hypothetical protein SVXHx_3137 [Haloferax lucentense]